MLGEQGWHSGESICFPMCPAFNLWTRCHTWIEFVGSLLCSKRFFPRFSGFPLLPKTNIQGTKLTFLGRSHLAPKFSKVVAKPKKLGAIKKKKIVQKTHSTVMSNGAFS